MNTNTLAQQIGRNNILAISGGRTEIVYAGTVADEPVAMILPVRYGYAVRVTLAGDDTYTVERIFTRSGRTTVKGVRTDVYADQVGEIAYQASCYHDEF